MKTHLLLLCLLGTPLVIPGCGSRELSGPPALRLGHHECAECGMLINEERCSAAMIVDRGRGPEYAMFDDIGCALDYEHDYADEHTVFERFFHDYDSKQWITTSAPVFLLADREKLATPMGSGIAGFATRAEADRTRQRTEGSILDFAGLVTARRMWLEERFGKPASPR